MKPFFASLINRKALVASGLIILLCGLWLVPSERARIESGYKARGFKLVDGCNGGAANEAVGQVHTIELRLEALADSKLTNSNVNVRLQEAYTLAQEKARILRDDCRMRGHRENKPWKTNWITIRQALTASEELLWLNP